MFPRLGVNIDHVATLRQQRGEGYPSVAQAAKIALENGADQITIHLREDRRHIQDFDLVPVFEECKRQKKLLNLEMGCTREMVDIAIKLRPDWICMVPEKREEKTTEGGLDVLQYESQLRASLERLKSSLPSTKISLFVESDKQTLSKCIDLKVDAVEIHTGRFARDFLDKKNINEHLVSYEQGYQMLQGSGVGFHAGHGLTLDSVIPLLKQGYFQEYNIGHWIISEAVFTGLGHVTKDLAQTFREYQLKG